MILVETEILLFQIRRSNTECIQSRRLHNSMSHTMSSSKDHPMRKIVALETEQRSQITVHEFALGMIVNHIEKLLVDFDLVGLPLFAHRIFLKTNTTVTTERR